MISGLDCVSPEKNIDKSLEDSLEAEDEMSDSASMARTKLEDILKLKMDKNRFQLSLNFNKNLNILIFSIAPYVCAFCSNRSLSMNFALVHINNVHPNWEKMLGKPVI